MKHAFITSNAPFPLESIALQILSVITAVKKGKTVNNNTKPDFIDQDEEKQQHTATNK